MSLSDALELAVINHMAGGTTLPAVGAWSLDLEGYYDSDTSDTTALAAAEADTAAPVASYAGYAALTLTSGNLTVSQSGGTAKIVVNIEEKFAAIPASHQFYVHRMRLRFWHDSVGGTLIGAAYSDANLAVTVAAGAQPDVPANTGFVFQLD